MGRPPERQAERVSGPEAQRPTAEPGDGVALDHVPTATTLDELTARARALVRSDRRVLLGIAGPPGAGKSTLAGALVDALGEAAVLVPMDGFHLAQAELERLGRAGRKGAPDTFDVAGYACLLERLHRDRAATVYAPEFRRDLEEPIAGALAVLPSHSIVVTEGNYLLLRSGPWAAIRPLLDEVWLLDVDPAERVRRLVARHVAFGRSKDEARRWVAEVDEPNAERIAAGSGSADLVVRIPAAPVGSTAGLAERDEIAPSAPILAAGSGASAGRASAR